MTAQQDIRLRLADDGDVDRLIDIHYACFHQDPVTRYVWRDVVDSETDYKSVMRYYNFRQYFRSESHIIMVAERSTAGTDRRQVVGYCIWEWATNPDFGDGISQQATNSPRLDAARKVIYDNSRREDFSSRPGWWSVEEIAVDPRSQRLGIARTLLEWGFKIVDDRNWMTAVVSSPAATRLYEKTGFHYHDGSQPAARREIKARGEPDSCNVFIMEREPRPVNFPIVAQMPQARPPARYPSPGQGGPSGKERQAPPRGPPGQSRGTLPGTSNYMGGTMSRPYPGGISGSRTGLPQNYRVSGAGMASSSKGPSTHRMNSWDNLGRRFQ
ncbi:acyl-CoA N-acyltransferase [Podospora appendiculata]|uniref:Acyl-CoA N-acyltransferase n=1 Tax=Podospora appendiculata TaxID=314037 RepID=A0AAE1CHE6_9PEZI|nr:acyl-CoA N-acyltransferase [Podospora appendiculata]